MKIAIPSNDKKTISAHFGRTLGFIIMEIEEGKVSKKEYLPNNFTGHSQGLHHEHNHEHNHNSHSGIFNAIGDCDIVIAGGMGRRLYIDFEQRKMQVFVTTEKDIDKAVELFINNNLDNNSDGCCNH